MKPLLEIQQIPISIELKVKRAKLQYVNGYADVEISRNKGGVKLSSRPIKVNLDTFESRNSVVKTAASSVFENAQRGKQAVFEASARYAQEAQRYMSMDPRQDAVGDIIKSRVDATLNKQFGLTFIPEYPAEIDWMPNELTINYEMDKLNFDWKTEKGTFEFVPGSIEFNILEYPRVVIKYIGDPIYVPPSANPNHVPVDARA